MKISILTLFPEMFTGPFDYSIVKKAKEKGLVEIDLVNIRDFGIGKHKIVDDTPYGGGAGMVMRVDVLHKALGYTIKKFKKQKKPSDNQKIILLSPGGKPFRQQDSYNLSRYDHLALICGHYEGVDERIKKYIDEEYSIGDYILTGGEIPAMAIIDSVTRLIPGVINQDSPGNESFSISTTKGSQLLEYPQYTRPQIYKKVSVPEVLTQGNHKLINQWRAEKSHEITAHNRPDLLAAN